MRRLVIGVKLWRKYIIMPTHYYAASGVKRVRYFSVTCKDSWPPCTVFARLNTRKKPERELGTITTKEDLLTGRDFQLQDGSLLRVRLHGARIHLMRNGQPLPQIPIPTPMLVERRILNRTNSAAAAVALAGILSVIGYPLFVLFLDGTGSDVSSRVPQLV